MGTPYVSWRAAADDAESPQARLPDRRPGAARRLNRERGSRESGQPAGPAVAGPAVSVLADRMAASLLHHEPGWRLPRHSALARRYNVTAAEIDSAVDELVRRHMLRRLADGQVYRASPAEYVIGLEGVPGLASYVDAMGGEFSCSSRQVTWRVPPEGIGWALRLTSGQQVCMARFLWTAGGEPCAMCTSYVPDDIAASPDGAAPAGLPPVLDLLQLTGVADGTGARTGDQDRQPVAGTPAALHIELQAPPPSVARSLRLTTGQPAIMVTVRFDEPGTGRPVALTIAVLRPDMFRIVVQTPSSPLPGETSGNLSASWTRAAADWDA